MNLNLKMILNSAYILINLSFNFLLSIILNFRGRDYVMPYDINQFYPLQYSISSSSKISPMQSQLNSKGVIYETKAKDATDNVLSKNLIVMWIDKNVYDNENTRSLKLFKNSGLNLVQLSDLNSLKIQLKTTSPDDIVLVISAASFEETAYQFMQQDQIINQVLLFCKKEEAGNLLQNQHEKFPKIKHAAYNAQQVLKKVDLIQQKYADDGLIQPQALIKLNFQDTVEPPKKKDGK